MPSIPHPIQRQHRPPFTPIEDVSDKMQLPRRLPRSTAAQKAIENDLHMATGIGLDLKGCEKTAALEPMLDLYHQLHCSLDKADKSIRLLSHWDARVQRVRNDLLAQYTQLRKTLVTWRGILCLLDKPHVVDTSHHFKRPIDGHVELTQVCFLLVFVSLVVMGISRRDGDFLIGMLTILLSLVCHRVDPAAAAFLQHILKILPSTGETVATTFCMDGKIIVHAVCVQCHANYNPADPPIPYPSTCTNCPTPESQCNASLLDEIGNPLKICSMHPFEDYLGSLFSDPIIEKLLIENKIKGPTPSIIETPHNAEFLRSFRGPDRELFCTTLMMRPGSPLRSLLISLPRRA
ncbi:hypothetical protein LXA43DRAFT_1096413 [Ganoderma leucocontextum]|nr:hypothetical protein LXA43DRAFT_1096413 [Ganoderma leucocontextum]